MNTKKTNGFGRTLRTTFAIGGIAVACSAAPLRAERVDIPRLNGLAASMATNADYTSIRKDGPVNMSNLRRDLEMAAAIYDSLGETNKSKAMFEDAASNLLAKGLSADAVDLYNRAGDVKKAGELEKPTDAPNDRGSSKVVYIAVGVLAVIGYLLNRHQNLRVNADEE